MRAIAIAVFMLAATLSARPLSAQSVSAISIDAADDLDAGQYAWRDDDPADGDVAVIVSRSAQRAYVFRGDRLIGIASVSTGKRGKATPLGDFTILQKRVFHRSNLYSDAPMPYMQRLTWDGIALHAGHNPGYPASHGCIRLPRAFAMLLYGVTQVGAAVAVVDEDRPVAFPTRVYPTLIAEMGALLGGGFAEVTWQPVGFAVLPYQATRLSVSGDEWLVPEVELYLPAGRRRL